MIVIPKSEDLDLTTTIVKDSGRLTSARFLSLHNGEVTELYKSSDYSTKEIKRHGASYRVLMQHIEAVVYRYLCDPNYTLIETKHKSVNGSNIRVKADSEAMR